MEIWTPPEKLDANVQRMAWLMFQDAWKAWVAGHGANSEWPVQEVYGTCLKNAKAVRELELEAGGQ